VPNLDGTGPQGKGPLTGKRRGLRRDKQSKQIENPENKSDENKEIGSGFNFNRRFRSVSGGKRRKGNKGSGKGFGRR